MSMGADGAEMGVWPSPNPAGNKENISQDGDAPLDFATLPKEGSASTRWKKKPAGFNLRKSIAWNPAFFTEEGVLDNSELSMLTGSQPRANRSPGSGVSSIMPPSCHLGRYGNTYVRKEAAENSHGKLPARYHRAESQGRKLFSSAKTPQRDKQKESARTQNTSSARSIQICTPRVPAGPIQKKVPNSSASTAKMSRIPKQSRPSLPKVPRSTSSATNSLESHKKISPVKAELIHRVTGLPARLKINSVSSGPSIEKEKDSVPAVTTICEEATALKCKKDPAHPQINPSSPFDSSVSKFTKPSALRMPSPSVGFFNQEKALVSRGDAKRNVGRCFSSNTSALDKPPRYRQSEESRYRQSEESRPHLTKQLSTNCTAASNLVPPVTRESNLKSLAIPEKESLSKVITTYIEKPGNVNKQARPKADFSLAGTGVTTTPQPMNLEKNDDNGNSVPVVSHVEGRGGIRGIEPLDNSDSLEAICSSTIEPVEDSFPLQVIYSSTKPIVGSKLSNSCISSKVCSSSELSCQGKSDSDSSAAIDLDNSNVGETALGASLSKDQLPHCGSLSDETPNLAASHSDLNDSLCDEAKPGLSEEPNTEDEMELETNNQLPHCGSLRNETPNLAASHSDLNDSLCDKAKPALSEEPNTEDEMELETNSALDVKETLHSYRTTDCSPMKLEVSTPCVERRHALLVEPNIEEKNVLDKDRLSAIQDAPHIEKNKAPDRSPANTILKDHLKNLVPFTEEWLAVMEARGQEVLEQKTGAVQNSPPDKTAPEPSPWSPVKRKAQDVGPFDCTKFSKNIRTSGN